MLKRLSCHVKTSPPPHDKMKKKPFAAFPTIPGEVNLEEGKEKLTWEEI